MQRKARARDFPRMVKKILQPRLQLFFFTLVHVVRLDIIIFSIAKGSLSFS